MGMTLNVLVLCFSFGEWNYVFQTNTIIYACCRVMLLQVFDVCLVLGGLPQLGLLQPVTGDTATVTLFHSCAGTDVLSELQTIDTASTLVSHSCSRAVRSVQASLGEIEQRLGWDTGNLTTGSSGKRVPDIMVRLHYCADC